MNHDQVQMLEGELETAIAQAVRRIAKDGHINAPSSNHVYHFMAKAAVAVLARPSQVRG